MKILEAFLNLKEALFRDCYRQAQRHVREVTIPSSYSEGLNSESGYPD
jgi:hypothetical protein